MLKNRFFYTSLAALAFLSLAGCDDQSSAQKEDAPLVAVTTQVVINKDITAHLSFVSRVEAIEQYDAVSRVEGFIVEQNFKDGDNVEAGAKLFQIEPNQYQNDIDRIKAQIEGSEGSLKEAQQNLKRANELIKRGNISEAKRDEYLAGATNATADIKKLQADLSQAELNLSYTSITTPIAGRIGKAKISVGNLVNASSGLLAQVYRFDPIYVTIAISEKELLNYRRRTDTDNGRRIIAKLRLSDGLDYGHEGSIDFFDNKVDPTTDTIAIRATFPNPDRVLYPNQFATMIIESAETEKALLVPQASIQENQSGRFVLVVDNESRVGVRNIEIGQRIGEDYVVKQGLEEGEQVIVQGLQKVKPGETVTMTPLSSTPESKD